MTRSENCSNHYSPLVQTSIQEEEGRNEKTTSTFMSSYDSRILDHLPKLSEMIYAY